jgi:predicted GNAT family N-acyltransferase
MNFHALVLFKINMEKSLNPPNPSKSSQLQILKISNQDEASMDLIGILRLDVWKQETAVDEKQFPNGRWLEPLDQVAQHWIATINGIIVGAARLSMHATLAENPDGYLWVKRGFTLPEPVGHFCKLVVKKEARGFGIGRHLNAVRIKQAKEVGAKSIIVTASDQNTLILKKMGFLDTGIKETFSNRPEMSFNGLQLVF